MDEFQFVDELPRKKAPRDADYEPLRAACRARPGQWARVRVYASASSATARAGKMRRSALWQGFEATSRGLEVYVRYVAGDRRG